MPLDIAPQCRKHFILICTFFLTSIKLTVRDKSLDIRACEQLRCACDQVHLFDIDIPGGITFKESQTLSPGESTTVVDTDAGRLGIGICYDIRFPELAMLYAQKGVQLIVYPGA